MTTNPPDTQAAINTTPDEVIAAPGPTPDSAGPLDLLAITLTVILLSLIHI